jgi:hypothetical protein
LINKLGVRLRECVLQVPHDATVKPIGSKLQIIEKSHDGTEVVRYHTPDPRCNDDIEAILDKQKAKRGEKTKKRDTEDTQVLFLNFILIFLTFLLK